MSTKTSAPPAGTSRGASDVLASAARLRKVSWYQRPRWRRLGAVLAVAVTLALMTGEEGTTQDLFFALREDFTGPALWIWVAAAVAVWAVREFLGEQTSHAVTRARGAAASPLGKARHLWETDRRVRLGAPVLLLALVAFGPLGVERYWQQVLVDQIAIFVLLAIGLNVVIGWAGLLDLGFIAFFAIGAYSAAYWTGALPVQPPVVLNNFLVLPIAVATCLVAGVILGAPTLRLRGDYLAIVTLGFHEIVYLVAKNADGVTEGTRGVKVERFSIDLGFFSYEWRLDPMPYYWLLIGFIVLAIFLFLRLEHSKVGRAWTAIREDEVAAAATGVNTVRYKLMAFAIGASTSGVAGVAYASKAGYFNPENFAILLSVLVLAYVIFGGMGSIPGVLFGAAFLVWLPEYLRDWVDPKDRYMYLGALLVIMMIYRPQGVWPSRRRKRELSMAEAGVGDADATGPAEGGQR
ncbi:branched-chain amino acid ABC transporter permease [Streptomyces sp. TRM43335]|uniref:Branched-chain amino acid ABC transporter permease n=1 Tax=Streptomyces taklimakanensis TaxID=2569853 RepID=A0A6G2B8I5_9ACTN|nr:branched-chain amino acid ABC transporter permease [Streptomyces taklimakanensis]MTE18577.1 branched-chain amino acid ABC transporter permease [Streptomyces taklimakanensis]